VSLYLQLLTWRERKEREGEAVLHEGQSEFNVSHSSFRAIHNLTFQGHYHKTVEGTGDFRQQHSTTFEEKHVLTSVNCCPSSAVTARRRCAVPRYWHVKKKWCSS
jgi:hypothetical protein